ncbi:MAG: Spy/CpxP family protein refolding chaperone [Campylobacterota bacterium]
MNKSKILASVMLGAVLSTSLFASNHKQMCDKNGMKKQHMMKHKMQKRNMFFSTIKSLNLSDNQKEQIRDIMRSSKQNKKRLNDTFTQESFNKEMFIKMMSEKRENMIKLKALKIEKIYEVLDKEQKKQFKTLIDLKTQKMSNRGKGFDKNCHDRR